MIIGVPKESQEDEKRVALVPQVVEKLIQMGFQVMVEKGAGAFAQFDDQTYVQAGAELNEDGRELLSLADVVLKVRAPAWNSEWGAHEAEFLRPSSYLVSFIWPAQNEDLMIKLQEQRVTVLAMDCVPRISRAQKLDALSSMANIAGYRAVIEAVHAFGRFLPGQITAAGKIPPAKVFVIGAGVAGLSAIGVASSLGAIVRATDTRSEVQEQVQSMGATFVGVAAAEGEEGAGVGGYAREMSGAFQQAQREVLREQCGEADIVITTALIPGKPAPKLLSQEMIESMRPGSIVVDLAAEQGGNCDVTVPRTIVDHKGVKVMGYTDWPSRLPTQSSQLYANNLLRLIEELCPQKEGILHLNLKDEMIRGAVVLHQGERLWPPPPLSSFSLSPPLPSPSPSPSPPSQASTSNQVAVAAPPIPIASAKKSEGGHGKGSHRIERKKNFRSLLLSFLIGGSVLALAGAFAPEPLLGHLTVFVLACFIGYMVVWNVTPALHTPLMSVTNAISSIIILGALVQASGVDNGVLWLAGFAIFLTSINLVGGFWVTQRMLNMFRRDNH